MRTTLASITMQCDRHLGDAHAAQRSFDYHLRGELHSSRLQTHATVSILADTAHPAMGVGHFSVEEEIENAGEYRVADPAVMPRHRARLDRTPAARTHHEVGALAKTGDEGF